MTVVSENKPSVCSYSKCCTSYTWICKMSDSERIEKDLNLLIWEIYSKYFYFKANA